MCPVVRISVNLYARLEKHAKGFDSPASVIEKLLNYYDGENTSIEDSTTNAMSAKPELIFHPSDEVEFLKKLVERKAVWVNIYKDDGKIETSTWNASRITPNSNLRANIWSGRLRDWKQKGIVKAEFYFDPKDFQK